jgi:hypothetical protein
MHLFVVCLVLLARTPLAEVLAPEGISPPGDWVDLELELPRPLYTGTPKDLFSPRLELPDFKHESVRIPADASNVALGKLVTSDVQDPTLGSLDLVTDGSREGQYDQVLELPDGAHYLQIDLEAPHAIYAVAVWHYHAEARIYYDIVVQIAEDPSFLSETVTLFNNDHDNSVGKGIGADREYIESANGKVLQANGEIGTYLRLYSNGNTTNDMNHYIEVAIYAIPAEGAEVQERP